MRRVFGVVLLATAVIGFAFGQSQTQSGQVPPTAVHAAPEVNPTTAVSALALLSGGLLVIRRRK